MEPCTGGEAWPLPCAQARLSCCWLWLVDLHEALAALALFWFKKLSVIPMDSIQSRGSYVEVCLLFWQAVLQQQHLSVWFVELKHATSTLSKRRSRLRDCVHLHEHVMWFWWSSYGPESHTAAFKMGTEQQCYQYCLAGEVKYSVRTEPYIRLYCCVQKN